MNIQTLLDEYLEDIILEKNQSKKTQENYQHYLSRFTAFIGPGKEMSDITMDIVKKFRLYLDAFLDKNRAPLSKKTQSYHVIALRAFLKYATRKDIETLAPEKISIGKSEGREVDYLSREELDRLFASTLEVFERACEYIDTSPYAKEKERRKAEKELVYLRDRAILEMLYSTGVRVSELCSMNCAQVDLVRREFSVLGKGRKRRIVFLSEIAVGHVQAYLNKRHDSCPALFLNHSRNRKNTDQIHDAEDRRLTTVSIESIVRKYAEAAGIIKKVTPHVLRHSFATELLMNGADIRSVQELLGHASITTTQIYTNVTDKHLKEVFDRFHK